MFLMCSDDLELHASLSTIIVDGGGVGALSGYIVQYSRGLSLTG